MDSPRSCTILFIGFVISIFIFLNGFLMNRSEIHDVNTCDNNFEYCKYSPYKKIIFLLVDALKYEFIDPKLNQSNYYHGNVDIVRSLKTQGKGKYSYLNHFVSDPPTTTLQRIKGLTTGSLPTFIDISTNFGSSELIEDNIIHQWQKFGFDIKFAGDDTWTHLFPGRFNESHPYPSFNVKDLDTVDRGVEHFIIDSLTNKTESTNKHPEIILGHMLGVDHCGHTYGKNHPQMKRKLNELNDFLKKIIALMDKDTLLVVFGDHGMTSTGDHGGDSDEEVDSAIFMVGEKPLNFHRQSPSEQLNLQGLSQIDFVPTLAAMTGVAIPFSNLGVLRSEMLTSFARAEQYLQMNIKQISQYVNAYENKFGSLHLSSDIRDYLSTWHSSKDAEQSLHILRTIQRQFRAKWAQFNVTLIYGGICGAVLHLISIFSVLMHRDKIPMKCRFVCYVILALLQLFITDSFVVACIFCVLIAIELLLLSRNLVTIIRSMNDLLHWVLLLSFCAYVVLPLSNSFIVSEDTIVQYFLQTILVVKTAQCLGKYLTKVLPMKSKRKDKPNLCSKAFLHWRSLLSIVALFGLGTGCLIFGMVFKICREEQRDWCQSDPGSGSGSEVLVLLVPLLLVVHRLWLEHCGNLDSSDFNVFNVKYLLPIAGISLFFHQCMQFVDHSSKYTYVVKATSLLFPRAAVIFSFVSLLLLVVSPLLILHRKRFDNVKHINVPLLFQYLRERQSDVGESVIVHGLATVYSSALFSALLASLILVAVFLKVQFVLGIVAVVGFIFVYSVLSARMVDIKQDDVCGSFPVWEMAVVMTLSTQYGFFGTGHQATISNIPWYAAFIGWTGDHPYQIIPAIMLNVNIFSSHILISLFGLLVPLLVLLVSIGPAHIFRPRQTAKKRDNDDENKDDNLGDFNLFKTDIEADKFIEYLGRYYGAYLACQSILTLGTIVSAGYGRRHLMAWKIFVPKMMYSVMALLIVYVTTMIGYKIVRRIHALSVAWRRRNT